MAKGGRRIPRDSTLIVDGYNVLFAGREQVPGLERPEADLPAARESLVRLLAAFQRQRTGSAWVVFDARQAPQPERQVEPARLRVIFPEAGESGDDAIVRLVRRLDGGRKSLVVTADRELRARVSAEKAQVLGSRAFLAMVLAEADRPTPPDRPEMTTDEWLRYFGCEPEDAG
jgi:predicted RNA-binding protein with PIN domain